MLTGKCISYGGSEIRPEATGYGLVYFVREMLATRGLSLEVRPSSAALWPPGPVPGARATERGAQGRAVGISGSGNVALFACEKVTDLPLPTATPY